MKLRYKPFLLEFKHPFGVSSNTRKETPTVFVKLEEGGFVGYGEACLPAYLGETVDGTISFFETAKTVLNQLSPPYLPETILKNIDLLSPGNNAAKAAIDIALFDLLAKMQGKTYRGMMEFSGSSSMSTSFTIGIDTEEILERKIKEAAEFSILKIKAGTNNDKDLISLIRKYTDKPLYVDVNQGWKNKEYVLEMSNWMNDHGVILLEQPMPVSMKEEMMWVTERSPIPTIADESVKRLNDLESLNESFSGVNIKLMKCTGLNEALKMIGFCKQNNIKILLGCMAESSCGTSAMAQLMQFADYIDLDAPLLYKNDPFSGVSYENGKVCLNDLAGMGVRPLAGFEIL
jgi:L-alanine-DL-glutamate epimerase-like enolase superfamily enzyme